MVQQYNIQINGSDRQGKDVDIINQLPPFITPPLTRTRSRIPQVIRSQTADNKVITIEDDISSDHDDNYLHCHDSEFVHQTPKQPECLTSVPITPVFYSPECANIRGKDVLTQSTAKNKKKRAAARKQMEQMHKCQKKVVSHSAVNNLFRFVRKSSIDSVIQDTPSIPTTPFNTIMHPTNSRVNL